MPRVQTIENATVIREVLAPVTEIQWNPIDPVNPGNVVFQCATYTFFGQELISTGPARALIVPLGEIMQRTYDVETPQGTVQVPALLIMGAIKSIFDTHYAEREAAENAPQPEPENP